MSGARQAAAVEARDDGPHEHGDEPGWTERLSFAFFDASSGFGGSARIELRPADRRAEGAVHVFIPGGALATALSRGDLAEHAGAAVGRLAFDRLEALGRWRIRCSDTALVLATTPAGLPPPGERRGSASQLQIELDFDPWMLPSGAVSRDVGVNDLRFVRVASRGHFEQAGAFSGRVRVGGTGAQVEGAGARARTWGRRDETASHPTTWFLAPFGPDLAMGARGVSLAERQLASGWVCRDGQVRAVKALRVEEERAGRAIVRARVDVSDDAGDRYGLDAEAIAAAPLREGGARVTVSLVRYRLGARETLGLIEEVRDG